MMLSSGVPYSDSCSEMPQAMLGYVEEGWSEKRRKWREIILPGSLNCVRFSRAAWPLLTVQRLWCSFPLSDVRRNRRPWSDQARCYHIRCATGACLQNLLCEGGRGRADGHRIKARIYATADRQDGGTRVAHRDAPGVKNDLETN